MTSSTRWSVELLVPEDADIGAAGESRTVEVGEDESILAAGRAAGLWLSADCQQGRCITCGAKVLSDEVDHSRAKRYYPEDEEADSFSPVSPVPVRTASSRSSATTNCFSIAPNTTNRPDDRSSDSGGRYTGATDYWHPLAERFPDCCPTIDHNGADRTAGIAVHRRFTLRWRPSILLGGLDRDAATRARGHRPVGRRGRTGRSRGVVRFGPVRALLRRY